MAIVNYQINGDSLHISIHAKSGRYLIPAKTIVDPTGDKCVIYDCYCVSLNRVQPSATDIEYYVEKVRQIVNFYEQELTIEEILNNMIQLHINKHGRIIDNDLMMIVSALGRTIEAIEGTCDGKNLILSALEIVLNKYIDNVFVTIYDQISYDSQPSLIPMKMYVENKQ